MELVSKETIKPSSPTPNHLNILKLSFLDQIAPPIFATVCLVYDVPTDSNVDFLKISRSLKNSLARVLTLYYPFAGRLMKDFYIDCNDQGVELTEKRFSYKLSDVKRQFDLTGLRKFFPFEPDDQDHIESGKVLAIQLNYFKCGGYVMGVCISHKIVDANSVIAFVKAWADASRGDASRGDAVRASFEMTTHFPPRNIGDFHTKKWVLKNLVSKIFVFNQSTIDALKREASSDRVKDPTRVEVITAFIWRRAIAMALSKPVESRPKLILAVHMVNIRERIEPPLPEYAIGNCVRPAFASLLIDHNTKPDDYTVQILVQKLRDSIKQIDANYVKNLQEDKNYLNSIANKIEKYTVGEVEAINFSSFCKFWGDQSDFGWGKPVWVGVPTGTYKNLVVLTNHLGLGGGIEALVDMTKEDMAIFEKDFELLPYVSSTIVDSMLKSDL